jgi:hypothetical protein
MSGMSFDDLVKTPAEKPKRVHQMMALLPKFELGIKNGHSLKQLCEALSLTEGEFFGEKPSNIKSTFYNARQKAAAAAAAKSERS